MEHLETEHGADLALGSVAVERATCEAIRAKRFLRAVDPYNRRLCCGLGRELERSEVAFRKREQL